MAGKEVKKCVQTERKLPQINSSTNIHGYGKSLRRDKVRARVRARPRLGQF